MIIITGQIEPKTFWQILIKSNICIYQCVCVCIVYVCILIDITHLTIKHLNNYNAHYRLKNKLSCKVCKMEPITPNILQMTGKR